MFCSESRPSNPSYYPPTAKQRAFLDRHKLDPSRSMSGAEARKVIGEYVNGCRRMPPTPLQEHVLRQNDQWREEMSRGEACDRIKEIRAEQQPPY
jgi:hypothetical protein